MTIRSASRQISSTGRAVAGIVPSRTISAATRRPFGRVSVPSRTSRRGASHTFNSAGRANLRTRVRVTIAVWRVSVWAVRVGVDFFGLSLPTLGVGVSHHIMTGALRKRNSAEDKGGFALEAVSLVFLKQNKRKSIKMLGCVQTVVYSECLHCVCVWNADLNLLTKRDKLCARRRWGNELIHSVIWAQ